MNNRGFTLVEMVVVLAVVAILAAILVPTVAKNINDAKITRATNEAQVIGAAMASFFKDLGRWPTSNGAAATLPDALNILRSTVGSAATNAGGGTAGWVGANWDTFDNHLVRNDPGAQGVGGGNNYLTSGTEFIWRGPYINEIKSDPWGTQYYCNVQYFWNPASTNAVWVLSAGADRVIRTAYAQSFLTGTPTLNNSAGANPADDIGFRIQ
jgi:prepilin-type N-terminal cleavage/methylation domain-containing protein